MSETASSGDSLRSALRARGMKKVEEIYGRDYDVVLAMLQSLDERLVDCAVGFAYGEVYNRVGLDGKTRELIMIATLAALNYPDQMVTHVIAARRAGATEEEIRDALLLIGTVAGFPCVIEALRRAKKVFEKKSDPCADVLEGQAKEEIPSCRRTSPLESGDTRESKEDCS